MTRRFQKAVAQLQDAGRRQVELRIKLLFENPSHPGLNAHPVKPDKHFWEAYANRSDRIIYVPEGSHLVLIDVVSHDDIGRYGRGP